MLGFGVREDVYGNAYDGGGAHSHTHHPSLQNPTHLSSFDRHLSKSPHFIHSFIPYFETTDSIIPTLTK